MKLLLLKYWDRFRSSFWFVPGILSACAAVLAYTTVAVDKAVTVEWLKAQSWAYTGGAEGASLVLSTISGSMITIVGVVFSMTLVALSLASSQLGPRLLRNFMRDPVNQFVLGTFVATFVYCLLVLRTIRRADENLFVPHLSVTFGVAFALASLGVLIYYIHHVSVSIQADEVVARIADELSEGIDRVFRPLAAETRPPAAVAALPEGFDESAQPVMALADGYLQRVDEDALVDLAVAGNLVLVLGHKPGQYLIKGTPVARAWPAERVSDELTAKLNGAFILGTQRTAAQDVEFPIQQLVEIAARALSPGINDPFTAIACVDRLGSALARAAQRDDPPSARIDDDGRVRLVVCAITFEQIAATAFTQLRQHARSNAAVSIRMLETIAAVGSLARTQHVRDILLHHADLIHHGVRASLPEEHDRRDADLAFSHVRQVMRNGPGSARE